MVCSSFWDAALIIRAPCSGCGKVRSIGERIFPAVPLPLFLRWQFLKVFLTSHDETRLPVRCGSVIWLGVNLGKLTQRNYGTPCSLSSFISKNRSRPPFTNLRCELKKETAEYSRV